MNEAHLSYPVENIPDEDKVYCYVHKSQKNPKNAKKIRTDFFTDPKKSCEWCKYTTPQETLDRLAKTYKRGTEQLKNPADYGVISLEVNEIRKNKLDVQHRPTYKPFPNQAHAEIIGEDEEFRLKLANPKIYKWEIPLSEL